MIQSKSITLPDIIYLERHTSIVHHITQGENEELVTLSKQPAQ